MIDEKGIRKVLEAAAVWAYCPDSGGYDNGVSVEGTCERLTEAVHSLLGEELDGKFLTPLEVIGHLYATLDL